MLIKHLLGSQPWAQYIHFIYLVRSNDVDEIIITFPSQMGNLKLEQIK